MVIGMDRERQRQLAALWAEAREVCLGTTARVERLDGPPSPLEFLREYVSANKPCLVRGGAAHWPAVSHSLWSRDSHLSRALGNRDVSVHITPDGRADALVPAPSPSPPSANNDRYCFASACVRRMPFSDALRLIVASGDSQSPPPFVAYAQEQNDCFRSESEYASSALAEDVEPDVPWATKALGCPPEAVNLWIGSGRSETSFHKDHYENLYAVVSGEKHFLLLPPTDVHRLYVRPYPAARYVVVTTSCSSSSTSSEDEEEEGEDLPLLRLEVEEPRRYVPWCSVDPYPPTSEEEARARSSFPLYFEGPEPFKCTVRAGDILYLPSMWFHHVRQTPDESGRTIAINYWYDMRFDIKYAYFNFLQSMEYPTGHSSSSWSENACRRRRGDDDLDDNKKKNSAS